MATLRPPAWLRLALVAALTLPAALAAQDKPAAPEEQQDEEKKPDRSNREPITLQVTNQNWQEMRIFAVKNGTRMRVANVGSYSTVSVELPRWAINSQEVRLLASPIGSSQRLFSDDLVLWSGDLIVWDLANNLSLSRLQVFGTEASETQ